MPKRRHYVVLRQGFREVVSGSWEDVEKIVKDHPGAYVKKVNSRQHGENYLRAVRENPDTGPNFRARQRAEWGPVQHDPNELPWYE